MSVKTPMRPDNPWFRTTGDYHDFWLVQRMLQVPERESKTGIDRIFRLDYMGSAEFEGNMAYLSLRSMRALGLFDLVTIRVERLGVNHDVHFVGPKKSLDQSIESFTEWMSADHLQSKEDSRFASAFEEGAGDRVDAWWAYRAGVVFTLDRAVAEAALAVFAPEKASIGPSSWWRRNK